MTRIQIRRDTSTNWSVNNPTPANGEPCYETDTHKFKIGDGVTKYTSLPYQGGGGGTGDIPIATTTTAGKVKPDGTTITITNDGTISAVGDGGATIDDSTTATTSVWSSSKTNTEITTAVDTINSTKNDNIFDISKFKVIGNPTITDDGVASGFDASNRINIPYDWAKDVTNFKITGKFKVENSVQGTNHILGYVTNGYSMGLSFNSTNISWFVIRTSSEDVNLFQRYSITPNIDYSYELQLNNNLYTLRLFDDTGSVVVNTSKSTNSSFSITDNYLRLGVSGNYNPSNFMTGSINLKSISITVDGKEVFNGLMNSTKPIYDAIKANNTELSDFKTETSTDFSAVNSALNEKANLTDLALKQNTLVSGTNIKTINGETILGEGDITVGGSTPANMVTTDTAQDITANKTFYGEIRVGADNNYATLAKFSKEALVSGDSTLQEHIDLGEADFVVQGNLGKKVYDTDKYVYKKYINVDDLSDNTIKMNNSISSQVAHMAMPSDKYIDLTLGAAGTTYTAPADGWIAIELMVQPQGELSINSNLLTSYLRTAFANALTVDYPAGLTVPVVKGKSFTVWYSKLVKMNMFKFVYAVGSEPVA